MRLRGKHKATYTPHVDDGDNVIVINAAKVVFTGRKRDKKVYYHHTGFIGGIKERTAQVRSSRASSPSASSKRRSSACCRAVRSAACSSETCGSIPGPEHPHEAQKPEPLDVARDESQEREECLTVSETIQSMEGLATLKPAAPEAPHLRAEARCAGARLRHRQAQERGRPRLDQAGLRQDRGQHPHDRRRSSPVRCCAC